MRPKNVVLAAVALALGVATATGIPSAPRASALASAPKIKRPGAPKAVQAVGVNTAIGVSWTAPTSNGGSPITTYTVSTSKGGAICSTTGATTCTVTGLINGTRYAVRVRASNAKGEGRTSAKVRAMPSTAQNCSYVGPDANLQDCDLSYVNLTNANLVNATLTGAHLSEVTLTDANLTNADLSNSALLRVIFQGTNLTDANLTNADLGSRSTNYSVDFEFADLTGADLQGTSAEYADFQYANLNDANLSDADLDFADLQGATANDVTLTGATWDETTCPDGTNSNAYNPQTCAFDLQS
jgi:uncharacterized protein YjbI with pentapeptide repeats